MSARHLLGSAAALLLAACGETPGPAPEPGCMGVCDPSSPFLAMASMEFVGESEPGKAGGFDLDASVGPYRPDCIAKDFTAPEGTPGIDNQLARLMPVLLAAIGEALPTLIQNSINEGGLSILMELVPGKDGGKPSLAFHRARGTPLLATDGRLLPGQTYDVVPQPPIGWCNDATVEGRRIECAGFDLPLAIVVFGILYELKFRDTRIVLQLDEAGEYAEVMVGGAVRIQDIYNITDNIVNGPDNLVPTVHAILPSLADLVSPDTDECDRISGAVKLTARVGWAKPAAL
jgi:hypothetical protein